MNNEQEWRQHILRLLTETNDEVKEIKKEMTTLKIKVAGFSAFVGSFAAYFMNKFFH